MFEHNHNNDNNSNGEENNPPPPYSDSFIDFLSLPAFATEESLAAYLETYFPELYDTDGQTPTYEEVHEPPQNQIYEDVPISQQEPSPTLPDILTHLHSPIHPFYNVCTGLIHPDFPKTIMDLHLLTESQLDSLFTHYNQVWPPTFETHLYPLSIPTWLVSGPGAGNVHVKRYWFGKFIGLGHVVDRVERVIQVAGPDLEFVLSRVHWLVSVSGGEAVISGGGGGGGDGDDGVEAMLALMEREWQDALARARGNGWK